MDVRYNRLDENIKVTVKSILVTRSVNCTIGISISDTGLYPRYENKVYINLAITYQDIDGS